MNNPIKRRLGLAIAGALALGSVAASTPASADEVNLIPDAGLRQCIVDALHDMGRGSSPGHPDYASEADSISQEDLDQLVWNNAANGAIFLNCGLADNRSYGIQALSGLENLPVVDVATLFFGGNQISDLSPLAGLTNLSYLDASDNQISDLTPLAGVTKLAYLTVDNNQISDLSPLAGLPALNRLSASDNQISDVTPLAQLQLGSLHLANNQISDISPLASIINSGDYFGPDTEYLTEWSLAGNHITDASVIDWAILKEAWVSEPSEYQVESGIRAVTRQTSTASGVAGTTVPLPAVTTAKGSPNPITWTVKSGDASIDAAAGKVTYNSAGPVMLTWSDSLAVTKECAPGDAGYSSTPPHYICLSTGQPPTGTVDVSFFSGQVSVNVTEADEEPPTPDAPSTDTTKDDIIASSTGGAARLADGDDSYDVITTIRSADGTPLTGYADRLTATAANEVNLGVITDNGDGTYTIQVSSDTPGNYEVTITLEDENGQGVIIDSIPVNFIGADIDQPTRRVSDEQAADGLGFLPGEQVKVTVHSDPIELGTLAADANGSVPVSFTIPEGFDIGRHTVDFVGETSGAVKVAFDVIDPSAITDPTNSADPTTGGGVATTPTAPGAKGDTGGQAGGSQTDILRLALIAMALGVIATGIVTLRRRSDNS